MLWPTPDFFNLRSFDDKIAPLVIMWGYYKRMDKDSGVFFVFSVFSSMLSNHVHMDGSYGVMQVQGGRSERGREQLY